MSPFDTANQNAFFDVPYPTNGKITPGFNPQSGLPSEYPAEYFKPNPIFDWVGMSPWNADNQGLSFMQKRDTLVGEGSVRNEQKVINI